MAHSTLSQDGKTLNDAFTQYLPDGMTLFSQPLPNGSSVQPGMDVQVARPPFTRQQNLPRPARAVRQLVQLMVALQN